MNFPLLDAFLTMMWFFIWVLWIFLVIWTIMNVFGRDDLSGGAKAGWTALIILVPFIGVFVYLVVRGGHLARRQVEDGGAPQDSAASAYQRWESHGRRGR